MSEYVPTTEMRDRIEDALMDYGRDREDAAYSSMVKPDWSGALAEILSVLAVARREGQAEAWDEGYRAGADDMSDLRAGRLTFQTITSNPYEGDRHVDQ